MHHRTANNAPRWNWRRLGAWLLPAAIVVAYVVARSTPVPDAGPPASTRAHEPAAPNCGRMPQPQWPGPPRAHEPASSASGLGRLRASEGGTFISTAGLRYGPGSREGHRLKHVLLHTQDQPDRPGSHGVFYGGRATALAVVDEAYQIARQRGPPTRITRAGRRTIYTVDMGRPVGFVGGRTGKKQGHPVASHVRLVLDGRDVITAFPLIP